MCCAICGNLCNPVNCVSLCACCKWTGSKLSVVTSALKKVVRLILTPYARLTGLLRKVVRVILVCFMRACLVLIAFAIAAVIPYFQLIITLVGGLATTISAFILPPLFHVLLFWSIKPKGISILNIIIFVFGVFASIITTVTTILQVIDAPPPSPILCKDVYNYGNGTFNSTSLF